ncbi:MAG: amino acid transporter [Pseudomonadota bacterium]
MTPRPAHEDAWAPWPPAELAHRLQGVRAWWSVVGGWALDLWHGNPTRPHDDLECATGPDGLAEITACLSDLTFFAARQGRLVHHPSGAAPAGAHQFWGLDPAVGRWRVDVMLEPGTAAQWVCRRDPSIRMPRSQIVHRDGAGVPYLAPEAVLLFKAKHRHPKDEADFDRALARMEVHRKQRLARWLELVHPGHDWRHRL